MSSTTLANRLALLAAIRAGEVTGQASCWWLDGWSNRTASVKAAMAAGLVEKATPPSSGRAVAQLTEAGAAVLDGAR
jgi:hypothetical protein